MGLRELIENKRDNMGKKITPSYIKRFAVEHPTQFNELPTKIKRDLLLKILRCTHRISYDYRLPIEIFDIDDIAKEPIPLNIFENNTVKWFLLKRTSVDVLSKRYNIYLLKNPQGRNHYFETWVSGINKALSSYGIEIEEINLKCEKYIEVKYNKKINKEVEAVLKKLNDPVSIAISDYDLTGGIVNASPMEINESIKKIQEAIEGKKDVVDYDEIRQKCEELAQEIGFNLVINKVRPWFVVSSLNIDKDAPSITIKEMVRTYHLKNIFVSLFGRYYRYNISPESLNILKEELELCLKNRVA